MEEREIKNIVKAIDRFTREKEKEKQRQEKERQREMDQLKRRAEKLAKQEEALKVKKYASSNPDDGWNNVSEGDDGEEGSISLLLSDVGSEQGGTKEIDTDSDGDDYNYRTGSVMSDLS